MPHRQRSRSPSHSPVALGMDGSGGNTLSPQSSGCHRLAGVPRVRSSDMLNREKNGLALLMMFGACAETAPAEAEAEAEAGVAAAPSASPALNYQ